MFFKQKQRFSIRKYSFGAASVLLGTVILGMAAPEASADTVQPETQQVLKEENTSVQTSDLSSPEMEAVSETPEIQSQEKLVQSTDTPIAEPVVASENPEGAATSVHATRVPSTDIPVTELADPSESAEVPATQVQETPAPSADTPVAEPVAAGESPEGDETSAQEENHPAPSALISDTADKPHVRSARSLPDSPADEQNLFEDQNLLGDVQNTLVDKTDLKELIGGRDAFKPTAGYTEGGKEEQDAYDKAIVAGEAVFNDASAKQEAVDTAIRNIKEADTRLRLSAAAALVKAAEEAAKAAQAKKQEVEQDATVDTDEEKAVDDLNKKTLGKITSARNVVDLLPEVAGKAPLKDRLDKIKTSGVVVGIVGTAIARAELHTRLTEQAARAAAAKKREVEADGAVNPAEKVEVDALNAEVTKFKKLAEQSVGNLPESREKTEFKDRLSKATTSEVVINDFDKDGKADEQDILEAAEASVQAADDMAQIVKSKKAAAESDGNVTQEEKTKIDDLNEAITANKEFAKSKVDNLPDSPDKAALKKWLDKITTSEVTVGSADNKVKSDKSDTAIARADFFTTSTESKAKAAAAKKKEVEADGAVNPAEKAEVDALNGQVANSKKLAEQFVDTLPEGQEKKEFKDRLSKVTTSGVKINDADSNGKSDELENRLSGFENIIRTAQASVQEAKDKKAEVEKDGFVTAEEKQAVDSLNAGITNVKEILKKFIDTLPEIPVKKDLSDRVAKLTTSEVTLGAVDSKGKATPNEAAALGLVKTLLTSAEQAAQKAQAKKTEVESDGVVTEAEKAEVDKLNTQITDSKKQLSTVLENLAAGTEKDGFKERFDKLTTSEVTVGAVDNSKDKADSQEEQGIVPIGSGDVAQRTLKDTEAAVESIEKMAQIVKAAAKDAESDGLVTPEEKASIDNLNKDLKTQKEHVASKVDNLSDSPDKAALKERLAKVTTVEVAVNDADSNGKVDAEEVAALRTAKNLATDAEQLVQSAKTKKAEAESDGVVTSEEKAEIDSLNTRITNSQKDLSTLLDNLADSTEKTALKERLAKLTTSEVTVGDVDSKIKSDKLKNAIARADFFTTSTEKAAQTAAAKKQEVEADGVVNPAEKQEVDALNAEVTKSKKLAEQLIDTLPENSETKELKARLAKVTTADVTVNDADNDGKVDSKVEQGADNTGKVDNKDEQTADNTGKADSQAEQDLALMDAKAAVKAAEDSAQFAKDKKTELEKDGAINQSEKAHLDRLNIFITADKKQAQSFVDKLPNGEAKTALQERLDKVTTVEVTVNDVNNDGKADNKEQQDIVPVVADDTTDSKDKADNKDEQADAPVAADDTANKGGLSDSQKITLDAAKAFTESAEEAAKKAQDRKAEVEKDGTVTAEEKQAVDSLNKNVTQAKNSATELVNSLPDNRDTADLKARLDKVTTADVTVGTVDSKDKVDSKDEQADAPVAAADNDGKVDSKVEQSADNTGKVDNKAEQAADNNGKSDSQAEQEAAVKAADLAVKDAEEAAQFAKDKKTELEKDGVINQSEKGHLDLLNTITTGAKQHAQSLVDKLSNGEAKTALQERLDKVTTVEVTVNDLNNDGKADNKEQQGIVPVVADDTTDSKDKADNKDEQSTDNNDTADSQAERDVALIDAQEAVKDAEDTAQFGKDNKAEAEKDGVITPSEKEHLDQIDISITAAKEYAQGLVDKLPDSDAKKALQERLAKVTTVEVTVSDVNNDSKADNKEQQDIVPVVADDTTDSKDKADNKDEQVADNTGKADSKDEQSDAPVAADDSDGKVDSKVEQSADNDGKIDNKDEQSADNTGKADSQAERDVALRHAQQAVEDAEEAAQFGKDNKAEAEKDGVITPSEKEHLDQIDTIITAAKQHAQGLVDELPDSDAKKALQERLAKITTSEVTVNDADSNGKADDKERLEKAEAAVKSVEALAQSAKDKKKEVESDGVVNPAEKEEVDRLNEKVTVNKDFVTSLINDNLPDSPEKAAFMDRLAKITTSEVTVNDADSNGKADSQDKQEAALAAAEAAVKAAEDAAKAGQDKKSEVEQDRLVTPAEKTAVDNLNKATADKKTAATALVDKLPDGDSKTALKDRLGKVTPSQVTVNDADSNGKADNLDSIIARADFFTTSTEKTAQAAKTKKAEVEKDGLVTPAEKQAVDSLNAEVTKSKQAAEKFVDTLPEGKEKNEFKARLAKVTTSEVTVNDANSNGKADNLDSIIARADFFTTSTEKTAQAAKTKKAEVEKDGLVTPAEKQAVDSLNAEVTKSKQAAEKFVDTLPEGKEKNEFKARLAKVTTSEVTVNDADSNGKADSQDRLEVAEAAVKAAEAAAKAGQDKKAEVEKDGLVNPLEKTVVDGLNKTTVDKKNVANALVDTLADSADKDALQARLSKVTTSEVTVNDANSNGKADTQDADFATAETAVKAAEVAAKAGQDKKAEVEKDGLVNPLEKTVVDGLNKTTVDKKDVASDLVDGLSDNTAKTALKERLAKVTTSQVTVNDADSNGKADSQDRLEVAEAAVKAAEAAAKAGQDKKAEVEKDGLVNPLEKTVVDGLNKTTIDKKNVADALVDTLADSAEKDALQARLAKVTTSEVTVNDADSNGKVDSQDAQEVDTATVEPAVKAAEDAAQVAKDKKAEVEADGLVNPSEKEALDELNAIVTDSKKHATALVDNLPDSAAKTALQARLAKVTTSEVTVNDTDSNGKADDQDRLEVTEAAVKAAEAAAKAGQDKKAEVESDGLVNPLEKTVVDGLNKTTVDKKNVASALVDTLADSAAKTALQARLAKVMISEVTVNDADSNGKVDSQDTQEAALASAEAAVKSAEAAAKAGQEKKAEIESDGLVTPAEKTAITDLNKTTVDEKDVATDLVDKLPDGDAKAALKARLAKVTTSQVTVNDADSNGKADDQDRLEVTEAAVKAAEAAAKAGQEKKAEVEKDGLVNPLEKTVVDGLNKTTVDKKNVASALVDTLPDSSAKTALEVRLAKVMISEVAVNDADSNGKVDSQEIEKPQVEPKPDDSPKVEKPQVEPKPGDSPKVEKPQMDPKPDDSPKVEKPQVEPKPGDSPKVEKPQVEPKPGDSPKVEKPQVEPKPGDSPKVEKPQMDPKSGDSDGGITGKAGQTVLPTVSKPAARAISSQPVKKTSSTDTVKGENLPRTGERSNQLAPLYGGGMALALATLLASKKRKRNSED